MYLANVCVLCGQRPAVDDRPMDVCFVSSKSSRGLEAGGRLWPQPCVCLTVRGPEHL